MSPDLAARAVTLATGTQTATAEHFAAGRSSDAWKVEGPHGDWIARIPVENSDRRITYRVESFIGAYLASRGHRVPTWRVVDVDGTSCSVARVLPGRAIDYGAQWSSQFGEALANVLHDLHSMPATGFGPLVDQDESTEGVSVSRRDGMVDRWFHGTIWPFDGRSLAKHPVVDQAPELVEPLELLAGDIEDAEQGPIGVVHSDLHREHLLVGDDGSLVGLLDFGDAFIGATAWDFALLNWYYGQRNASMVADHYPGGASDLGRGLVLSIAVGLYKLAKDPADRAVLPRLRRCIDVLDHG